MVIVLLLKGLEYQFMLYWHIKDESSFSKICNTYGITRKDIKDCINYVNSILPE